MLVELLPAEDEEEEEDGNAVEEGLDDPRPEGRVHVDQVATLPVFDDILTKKDVSGFKSSLLLKIQIQYTQ